MSTLTPAFKQYYREFSRQKNIPVPTFEDKIADKDFLVKHFIDFFGKDWIPQFPNSLSFDSVVTPFFKDENTFFQVFTISDGSKIQSTKDNPWLRQSLRFVGVAARSNDPSKTAQPFANNAWTLFIVGSSLPKSETAFLQVASWNGQSFRYYERTNLQGDRKNPQAWIYLGDSFDAFGKQAYLGPFNGHVNGSLVMKELHDPWPHWLAEGNDFTGMVSATKLAQYDEFPYLTQGDHLSAVKSANLLEGYIKSGITKWFTSRRQVDFIDKGLPKAEITNVKRWFAHILLTTTVNIGTAKLDTRTHGQWNLPLQHFYNSELISLANVVLITPQSISTPSFTQPTYDASIDSLKLALIQSGTSPDKSLHPTILNFELDGETLHSAFVAQFGEGDQHIFQTLQPSFEDIQGVTTLLASGKTKTPLVSEACLLALFMIDPWNPVYSWRRGVLMQYIPDSTKLIPAQSTTAAKYDLEAAIEATVKASPRVKDTTSPEAEFLSNLTALRKGTSEFASKLTTYLSRITSRLSSPNSVTKTKALTAYLSLAESRRRVYRPLPLDEFDLTMPWAVNWPADSAAESILEMTKEGEVVPVPERGRRFLRNWIRGLAGGDPELMPMPDANAVEEGEGSVRAMMVTQDGGQRGGGSLSEHQVMAIQSLNLSCQGTAEYIARIAQCPRFSAIRRRRDDDNDDDDKKQQ